MTCKASVLSHKQRVKSRTCIKAFASHKREVSALAYCPRSVYMLRVNTNLSLSNVCGCSVLVIST